MTSPATELPYSPLIQLHDDEGSKMTELERIAEAVRMAAEERKAGRFTRAGRKARGRPTVELSLPQEVVDMMEERCSKTGETRSAVVAEALRQLLAR